VRVVTSIATVLFVVCIPILLVTTWVRFAVNNVGLYEYEFRKYDVTVMTGMDEDELRWTANRLITYFNSDEEYIESDLYTERETEHLKDVKGLIQLAYRLEVGSLAYIVLYVAAGFALRRGAFWRDLAKRVVWGGGVTVALLAILGIWAATGFDELFLWFHLASFRNDFWQLYAGDKLLLLFPEGFFNDAALLVGGAAVLEALVVGGLAWAFLRLRRDAGPQEAVSSGGDAGGVTRA